MRRTPGRAVQSPRDELPRQPGPDHEASHRDSRPAHPETEEATNNRADDRVVVTRRSRLHPLPVELRMLLVEQRVVLTLPLLAQTHAPRRRAERMDDDGILGGHKRLSARHEGQPEIA